MESDFNHRIFALFQAAQAAHQMLRDLPRRKLCRGTLDGVNYVMKAYRLNGWQRLLGLRPASVHGSQLLEGLTPPVEANFVMDGWQMVVTRDCGGPDLFRRDYLAGEDLPTVFCAAGELLAKIHLRGLYHRDTKSPNFVINHALNSLPPVAIIDCDEVRAYGRLSEQHRIFNLAQFISCYVLYEEGELVSLLLMALEAYRATSGMKRDEMNRWVQKAIETAQHNRHVEVRVTEEVLEDVRGHFSGNPSPIDMARPR